MPHLSSAVVERARYLRRQLGQLLYGSYERAVHHELTILGRGQRPSVGQFKLLPRILNHQERRTALALILLAVISLTLLTWRWYDRHSVVVPAVGGEYAEAIVGLPRTANPLLAVSDADRDLAELTHRGLFQPSDSDAPVLDLAESWQVSPDQKSYRISLRPGLAWSDGEPLTADDVEFTFQSLHESALASPAAATFQGVKVIKDDERTITFTLTEPYAPFLNTLTLGLIPAHQWRGVPFTDWRTAAANLAPVGTGPFRVQTASHDRQGALRGLTLEPNPYTHTEKPYLTKIILKFFPDSPSALVALREGSVDGLGGLTRNAAATVGELRFQQYNLKLPQYTAVFYNVEREGPLASKLVRQALSCAINRQQLIREALGSDALPATNLFAFGDTKVQSGGNVITYSPTQVAELLQQAGYSRADSATPYRKGETDLAFTLTAADSAEQAAIAAALQQQWQAVGITVNLELVPRERLQAEVIPERSYEALLAREIIGFDLDPYPFWHSSQAGSAGLNLSNFKHHDADMLLEEARRDNNEVKRLERYAKFSSIITEESPASFLYSVGYTYAVSRTLKTHMPTAISRPSDRFHQLNRWYRGTQRSFQWYLGDNQ